MWIRLGAQRYMGLVRLHRAHRAAKRQERPESPSSGPHLQMRIRAGLWTGLWIR